MTAAQAADTGAAVRVLLAPDKFKHALSAEQVVAAMQRGIHAAQPGAACDACPLSDGGEGAGRLLAHALRAAKRTARVCDPRGRRRAARWWLRDAGLRLPGTDSAPAADLAGPVAILEMAQAAGLALLDPRDRDPTLTTTFGVGELIRAACDAGCRSALLCIGGSATVDGGAGCLQALGWKLVCCDGSVLPHPASGGDLLRIARLVPPDSARHFLLVVLCDVTNPLLGPEGAVAAFGRQKFEPNEAPPTKLERLRAGIERWSEVLQSLGDPSVCALAGGGAAGGIGAGLAAACAAELRGGFDVIAGAVGLAQRMQACDWVLTGEGRLDAQTRQGKVVAGVAQLARSLNKPVVALVGAAQPLAAESIGLTELIVLSRQDEALDDALRQTEPRLDEAARAWAARTLTFNRAQ